MIASKTGGAYYRATDTGKLREIYDSIDRLERRDIEVKKFRQYRELFPALVLPAFVLVMLEIILSQTVWRKLP